MDSTEISMCMMGCWPRIICMYSYVHMYKCPHIYIHIYIYRCLDIRIYEYAAGIVCLCIRECMHVYVQACFLIQFRTFVQRCDVESN